MSLQIPNPPPKTPTHSDDFPKTQENKNKRDGNWQNSPLKTGAAPESNSPKKSLPATNSQARETPFPQPSSEQFFQAESIPILNPISHLKIRPNYFFFLKNPNIDQSHIIRETKITTQCKKWKHESETKDPILQNPIKKKIKHKLRALD